MTEKDGIYTMSVINEDILRVLTTRVLPGRDGMLSAFNKASESVDLFLYVLKSFKQLSPKSVGIIHESALQIAASTGLMEAIHILLSEESVDVACGNNCALRYASEFGHLDLVNLLLTRDDWKTKVDPTAVRNYAVQKAFANGHVRILKLLMNDPRVVRKLGPKVRETYTKKMNEPLRPSYKK
ncbi:UNVERIFIED_CONTAM: hypothetical protein HDU68_003385 [Siphonaria sp. JEL0065]|nr:hypothetical protein HDU68_003385 [Siphonaria sp. JEL0065]